ncbi:MAG: hypothetical protein VX278_09560, partial [Myxococcota bacterium]|nr:hypothetical protein [Myxococcota bacterium]
LRLGQVLYDAGEASFLLALWSGQLSIDDSLEERLFRLLLERKDRHVLERWIEQAPRLDQRINEALSRNESLLRIAWRMDKKARRRQELLTFATLQSTLPDWAFSVAQREILQTKQWPSWLSPYREEALPLIQEIFLQSAEPHRLWWGSIIHRHRPWDPVFVASLRYWLCQDPKPLERSFISVPGFAFDQTPGFSIEELLHYIRISPQFEEDWVITGLLRLWGTGKNLNPTLALLLIDQLRLRGAEASLLSSDWRRLEPTVRHRLYAIWVEEASIDDLKKELDSGGVLASQAMSKLISLGDTFAIQRAKESFVEKMNGSFLRQLCSVDPQSIIELFSTALQKNPQEISFLLQQANSILPYLHEYAFELRLWIRKQANL